MSDGETYEHIYSGQDLADAFVAALAVINRNPPAHIAELVDFARTGDLRP